MLKQVLIFIILTAICIVFPAKVGHAQGTGTPEQLVHDFYVWYAKSYETMTVAEMDDEIYNYVYSCTVNKLRIEHKMSSTDSNYFIKGNDHWPQLFTYISVGKAVKINDDVSIVPLGFGETKSESAPCLAVFTQKEDGVWRIIKVEDDRGH